jgi:hypothetical protein
MTASTVKEVHNVILSNSRYDEVHITGVKPQDQIEIACRLASRIAWMENELDLKAVLL